MRKGCRCGVVGLEALGQRGERRGEKKAPPLRSHIPSFACAVCCVLLCAAVCCCSCIVCRVCPYADTPKPAERHPSTGTPNSEPAQSSGKRPTRGDAAMQPARWPLPLQQWPGSRTPQQQQQQQKQSRRATTARPRCANMPTWRGVSDSALAALRSCPSKGPQATRAGPVCTLQVAASCARRVCGAAALAFV
jgi:hypothetical protein